MSVFVLEAGARQAFQYPSEPSTASMTTLPV